VGTPEQIERFVTPFLAEEGAPLAAMAFSEPEGSVNFDADGPGQGVRTTAVLDGNEWVINGRKAWASHLCGWDGDGPDIMTIVCRRSIPPPSPPTAPSGTAASSSGTSGSEAAPSRTSISTA
jgi:alkylation response protein AidB-like acyl-CoA dehydrogenase